ncbi:MAG: pyridoxal-phosphate dependent enzyme, partial [Myxococcales bacterium]
MNFSAWFSCINGCSRKHSLEDVVYRCPDCGDLLEVTHDVQALKARSAEEWKALFDARYRRAPWPYASGVWGKKEWVHPGLDDANVVSTMEGASSLFRADRLAREVGAGELWIKQCGQTHTGSFKDLGMTVLVSAVNQMRARGRPIRAVACASTGDTSATLSAYAAAAGMRCRILVPETASYPKIAQIAACGAEVLTIKGTRQDVADAAMRMSREIFYASHNWQPFFVEGTKTLAYELWEQLGFHAPDNVVIPVG